MAYQENLQNLHYLCLPPEMWWEIPIGKGNLLRDGSDIMLIANGIMVADALKAQMLEQHPRELQHLLTGWDRQWSKCWRRNAQYRCARCVGRGSCGQVAT